MGRALHFFFLNDGVWNGDLCILFFEDVKTNTKLAIFCQSPKSNLRLYWSMKFKSSGTPCLRLLNYLVKQQTQAVFPRASFPSFTWLESSFCFPTQTASELCHVLCNLNVWCLYCRTFKIFQLWELYVKRLMYRSY